MSKFSRDERQRNEQIIDVFKELLVKAEAPENVMEETEYKVISCDFGTFVFNEPKDSGISNEEYLKFMVNIVSLSQQKDECTKIYNDNITEFLRDIYEYKLHDFTKEKLNDNGEKLEMIDEKLENARNKLFPIHPITYFNIDGNDENDKIYGFVLVKDKPNSPGAYGHLIEYMMSNDLKINSLVDKAFKEYKTKYDKKVGE